ncbi:winged helix-turn-helix domain-containing protein [Shewanella sp. 10N.286.52.A9]|nr:MULTISPECIES: winged helix-turn-helix domain-containing protein [Shewanella]
MKKEAKLTQTVSKAHKAFLRKLYLCYLISQDKHNLLSLHKMTQMPRRTIQDTLASMSDIGVTVQFIQEGERHNAGYYKIDDWGPINPQWLEQNYVCMTTQLETTIP